MNTKRPEKDILNRFSAAEREEVLRLWDIAGKIGPSRDDLPFQTDLDSEWGKVQQHIERRKREGKARVHTMPALRKARPRPKAAKSFTIAFALAALILGGFLMWYLFVPVIVEVPRGEFTVLDWDDGIKVELNSGSTISWNRSLGNGHRNVHLHGEAYFDIPSSEKPFVVETHSARVEVLGTRFNVRCWTDDPVGRTTLALVEGEVRLASLHEPRHDVMLYPGQRSQVDINNTEPLEPEPVDVQQVLAWRERGFYFSSIPMTEVAAELERRYDARIAIEGENLRNQTLTIYLPRPGDLENIIESICFVSGCRYDADDQEVRLY